MTWGFNKREPTNTVKIHQRHHPIPTHQGTTSEKKREKHMQQMQARTSLSNKQHLQEGHQVGTGMQYS